MTRNWGLPQKTDAFRRARRSKPFATLFITALFGVLGAAVAVISFAEARDMVEELFHGKSLILAVLAAGFGCWAYVWLARPRFAEHFTGTGGAFSDLLRFYVRAAAGLCALLAIAAAAHFTLGDFYAILVLCLSGGAGAAAAFQTVLAFVPGYEPDGPAS